MRLPRVPGVTFSAKGTKAGRAAGAFKDAARRGRCQEAPGAPQGSRAAGGGARVLRARGPRRALRGTRRTRASRSDTGRPDRSRSRLGAAERKQPPTMDPHGGCRLGTRPPAEEPSPPAC
ncbi:hypothetical protein R6Z07F_011118 [Ovis aries]